MGIQQRIKSERERLGLTQTALADAIGSTKRSVINWEGGAASPPAEAVANMANAGADVLYILTGQRSKPVAEVELLPEGERIMLDNFRHAPAAVQAGVKQTLGAFAPSASGQKRKLAS
jgi:transcriptional regulator with XRE-family HTH domain